MRKDVHRLSSWSGNVEQLEERVVMSADPLGGLLGGAIEHHAIVDDLPPLSQHQPVDGLPPLSQHDELPPAIEHHQESQADFWIDYDNLETLESELERIEQSLSNAHDQSGLTEVRNDYGFDGAGQTVAIIDSGIAYDHFALGGGLGSDYRVVGGWDFTGENDANPYDDGPSGSHGTHVAGIVGASGGTHDGVAPGVDLVGLRVFDDAGDGYFSWVEDALQWVYDNRDTFENPITAVNLSLGVASWNSDAIPSWANLENEFSLLNQAGIFVSVSAGNSFTNFNSPGLSYPAASEHVVPVASVDDSGLLSYYSQRNSRVIAAPGRGIISTVPDYKGNNDGTVNDYASFSGTSMAAPYVAGASVIVREAMEFVGYTNITQQTIYDHMISTADSFYDSATDAYYNRLNLDAAIDALMPTDDFGSTLGSAFDLGTISTDSSMNGAITTLNDVDYFKFTASATGSVSFTVSNLTHDLAADWQVSGGTGVWSGANNEVFTVDVVAGQEYTVGFSSQDGLGYYDLDVASEGSAFTYTDWGAIAFAEMQGMSNTGESWYRVEASSAGFFTGQAFYDAAGGQIDLELYDSNMQSIGTGSTAGGASRINGFAHAGEELFLKVIGDNSNIDFRLTNLVSISGSTVTVNGTAGDDVFDFTAGSNHEVSVNGVNYLFSNAAITSINFDGGGGNDSISMTGTSGNDEVTLQEGTAQLVASGLTVLSVSTETINVDGGGGEDTANFYDSSGDDNYRAYHRLAIMSGNAFQNQASNFTTTLARSINGGLDIAQFQDSSGDDTFDIHHNRAVLSGDGFFSSSEGFDRTYGYAYNGGHDVVNFYDSTGDDAYSAYSDVAAMSGTGFYNYARSFEETRAYSTNGGTDSATFVDSSGDDSYRAYAELAIMSGDGFNNQASGFAQTFAYAINGGNDIAQFQDSAGNDVLNLYASHAFLTGTGFYNYTSGFDRTFAYAYSGGHDVVNYSDSIGNDTFTALSDVSSMSGSGYYNYARGFDVTSAYATGGGNDTAVLYDSAGDDEYRGYADFVVLSGTSFVNQAVNFEQTYAHATYGGNDIAQFQDSAGDDVFNAYHNRATLSGAGFHNFTGGFERTYAYAYNGGNDTANFYDSSGDDRYYAYPDVAAMVGDSFYNYGRSFEQTNAYTNNGGTDIAYFIDSAGDDHFTANQNQSEMSGSGFRNRAHNFEQNYAYGNNGGSDTVDLYDSSADDALTVRDMAVTMLSPGVRTSAYGFEQASLYSENGGVDTTDIDASDYAFSLIGDWA
ncbi:MAG: S8 family serine peptidase [Planctomycetota bacterium]